MIKAHCFTNLDEYQKYNWPSVFVAVPQIGDWVEAVGGKVLTVVRITHCTSRNGEPYIRVELHK